MKKLLTNNSHLQTQQETQNYQIDLSNKARKFHIFIIIISLALGIVTFLLAGNFGINIAFRNEKVPVVVAANILTVPRDISSDDFTVIHMPRENVPERAFANLAEISNTAKLYYPLDKGQILTEISMTKPVQPEEEKPDPELEAKKKLEGNNIASGFKGFILPSSWFVNPMPNLKAGDTVSILYILKEEKGNLSKMKYLVKNLKVISLEKLGDNSIKSIMVEIDDATLGNILEQKLTSSYLILTLDSVN